MLGRRTFLLLWTTVWAAISAAGDISVIPLHHRMAAEVLPVIRPLLGPEDALSASGQDLILRADPGTAARIRALIRRIDKAPANLLITVRRTPQTTGAHRAFGAGVQIESGDLRLQAGAPDGPGVTVQGQSRDRVRRVWREQPVRAVEGVPALLRGAGELEVIAQLTGGDRVELTVRSAGPRGESELDTVVTGHLGQWITLGGIRERRMRTDRGLLQWDVQRTEQRELVQVRVDRLEP